MVWPPWSTDEHSSLARYVLPDVADQVRPTTVRDDAIARGDRAAVVRAIYNSLLERDLHYSREKWDHLGSTQRIREPEDIFRGGNATCLDLAVLFAGACLGHELLPLIVVVEGHAFVAVSLLDDPRVADSRSRRQRDGDWITAGVLHDGDVFARLVAENTGHYLPVECTGFAVTERSSVRVPQSDRAASGTLTFDAAVEAARVHCFEPLLFAVDPAVLQRVKRIPPFDRPSREDKIDINRVSQTAKIVCGGTQLTLNQVHLYSIHDGPRDEFEFLLTDLRATKIIGRDSDILDLKAWLSEPTNVSVRCLTGNAGAGKTRLAVELCEEASTSDDDPEKRWVSGFVSHEELIRFTANQDSKTWQWSEPTLIVVDDASACARPLRSWLIELSRRVPRPHDPKLRLLLLERQANPDFGWWKEVFSAVGTVGRNPAQLLSPRTPVDLLGLNSANDRRLLLLQVIRAVSEFRDVGRASQMSAADRKALTKIVENPEATEPLHLIMAGIVAVIEGTDFAVSLATNELAKHIAVAEMQRVKKIASAHGVSEEFAVHLAACVTLQGGCDLDGLKRVVREEASILHRETVSEEKILTVMAEALPSARGIHRVAQPITVDAIRPDLVGEALVLNEIGRPFLSALEQVAIVERAWHRNPDKVRVTLLNISRDFWREKSTNLVAEWMEHVAKLVHEDLKNRLETGQLDPNVAVDMAWENSFTTLDWFKLTTLIKPFADRLDPTKLGQFATLRAVSYVEGNSYKSGLDFSEEMLRHPSFPQHYRPELFNVKGRCLFHMFRYPEAADAYQAGIDAAGPDGPLIDQLYINLGNALLEDYQRNKRAVFPLALAALEKGVALAGDPRLQVEARSCLSNAFIVDGQLNTADRILVEAWKIAQDVRSVPGKARMYVMRNRAIVAIALGNLGLGIRRFDAAVEHGKSYFGPCNGELVDLYEYRFRHLVAASKRPPDIIQEMLEVWAEIQTACGIDSFPAEKFRFVADEVAKIAMDRCGLQNCALLVAGLFERGAHQGWTSAAIKEVTSVFRR